VIKLKQKPTDEQNQLLRSWAHADSRVAGIAGAELAKGFTMPVRQGVLKGDILANIYTVVEFTPGQATKFPLDFLSPGTESDFMAYTIPFVGGLPSNHVSGDYVMVPVYRVGNSIEWDIQYMRDARWDVVARALQVLEAGFILKANLDGWRAIIAAAAGRNLVVYDDAATAGLFTKRAVALGSDIMARNAGGNSSSINRGELTDLFISIEAHSDILSWDLTQVPDAIRTQIWMSWQSGGLAQLGPVTIHRLYEFGLNQEFNSYFLNTLGGSLPTDKVEVAIGLDLGNQDSFVSPVVQEVEVFEDPTYHRAGRASLYGTREHGFGVLDNRRCIAFGI